MGRLAERLPAENHWVKLSKALVKSLLFRRRLVCGRRIVFEGLEDAVLSRFYEPGPGAQENLVNTLFTVISPGTERGYYLDSPNFHQPRPYVPGHSGSGILKSAGKEAGLKRGIPAAGVLRHSNWNVRDSGEIVPVPPGVEIREAAFVTLGVIALAGIRDARIAGGEKLGILGQGILGQILNQLARIEGAARVTGLALGDSKRPLAEKSGVDEFVALKTAGRDLSSFNFDVVIDSTGSLQGFESALEMVRPGGRVVMLGSIPDYGEESHWARVLVDKGVEVRGSCVRNLAARGLNYRDEAARFLGLLGEKKLKLAHLITDVLKPHQVPDAYRRLAEGGRDMVGVIIDWQ